VDPLFIGGLLLALLGIVIATIIDGNSLAPLLAPSSFMLVSLATIGAGVMAYRKNELMLMPRSAMKALRGDVPDMQETITELGQLADTARRQGMLALEARAESIDDRFLATGVQLLVDGADEDVVRETMEIEIAATDERHRNAIGFFKALGAYAPTFGMVGTVIGLINMLGNLQDPAQLGRGMALALLTTFYGVLLANLIFNPLATRLERLNEVELATLDVALDGLLTIRRGASPRNLVERLESYLPPSERIGVTDRLAAPAPEAPTELPVDGEAA
jgi:chemotaxis protein MotA